MESKEELEDIWVKYWEYPANWRTKRVVKREIEWLQVFFSKISRANLEEAEKKRKAIEKSYWFMEVDSAYRFYHDSYKMFYEAKGTIAKYIDVLLTLVGEKYKMKLGEDYNSVIDKLRALNLDSRFVRIMKQALVDVKFHEGKMKLSEWRRLSCGVYNAKIAADSSVRVIEDILKGELFLAPYDFYTALFLYLWGMSWSVRYKNDRENELLTIVNHGQKELQEIYKPLLELNNKIKKIVEEVIKSEKIEDCVRGVNLDVWTTNYWTSHIWMRKNPYKLKKKGRINAYRICYANGKLEVTRVTERGKVTEWKTAKDRIGRKLKRLLQGAMTRR